jgi:hypothetical protein
VYKSRTLCLIKGEGGPRAARQADVIQKCSVSPMISVPAGAAYCGRQRARPPFGKKHKLKKLKKTSETLPISRDYLADTICACNPDRGRSIFFFSLPRSKQRFTSNISIARTRDFQWACYAQLPATRFTSKGNISV